MKSFDTDCHAVIMCGISGSGKTHYALKLEEKGYIRLSPDALIWGKIGSKLFNLTKEEQRKIFRDSRNQILQQLIDLLKSGKKVVVDATHCKRSIRNEIRNVCASVNFKPIFLYCQADFDELWKRLALRKGNGPDDLIVNLDDLKEYWFGFERPQKDESDFLFADKINI